MIITCLKCHILKIITLKVFSRRHWIRKQHFQTADHHRDLSRHNILTILRPALRLFSKKLHFNVLAKIYTIKLFTQTQTLINRLEFYQHWHVPNITNMLAWFSYTHSNIFAENIMWTHADWITSFRIPLEHRRTRERIKNNNSAKIPRKLNVSVS